MTIRTHYFAAAAAIGALAVPAAAQTYGYQQPYQQVPQPYAGQPGYGYAQQGYPGCCAGPTGGTTEISTVPRTAGTPKGTQGGTSASAATSTIAGRSPTSGSVATAPIGASSATSAAWLARRAAG